MAGFPQLPPIGIELQRPARVSEPVPRAFLNDMPLTLDGTCRPSLSTSFPLGMPQEASRDLAQLFARCNEGERIQEAIGHQEDVDTEVTFHTDYGPLRARIKYNSRAGTLEITLAGTEWTKRTLKFSFNQLNLPVAMEMTVFEDDVNANPFYYLLEGSGSRYLAARMRPSLPADYQVDSPQMRQTISQINNYNQLMLDVGALPRVTPDNPLVTHLNQPYNGPQGLFVPQGRFNVEPLSTPLATDGLALCTALIIIDETSGRHYLAHIDNHVSAEQLAASLMGAGLNLQHSRIYVLPGDDARRQENQTSLVTVIAGLRATGCDRQPEVLEARGHGGVTSYNGQLFLGPTYSQYFTRFEEDRNHQLYSVD